MLFMPPLDPHTMTSGDVALALGLSRTRVLQLDAELAPVRRVNQYRRYDPAKVQAYRERKAAGVKAA